MTAATTTERQALEQAVQANPADPQARLRLAQFEARVWEQAPEPVALERVVLHLDAALATLPEANRPAVAQFAKVLHQKGAQVGPIVQSGKYPRLLALLSGRPVPQEASAAPTPAPAPVAAPAPIAASAPPSEAVPDVTQPMRQMPQAAGGGSGKVRVRTIEVGVVTMPKIKEWLDGGKIEELTNAFPQIDNFRTRRLVVDKLAEVGSPLAVACLVRILGQTHDETLSNEIKKKLLGMDADLVTSQLEYGPNVPGRQAAIALYGLLKTEGAVEPLSEALGDTDAAVRALAIQGLSGIIEASDDWMRHLAEMMKTDGDAGVRMASARALKDIATKEAFTIFEEATHAKGFDKLLLPVLEEMRSQHGSGRAQKLREAAAAKGSESKDGLLANLGPKEWGMIGLVVVVLGIVAAAMVSQVKSVTQPFDLEAAGTPLPPAVAAEKKADIMKKLQEELAKQAAQSQP